MQTGCTRTGLGTVLAQAASSKTKYEHISDKNTQEANSDFAPVSVLGVMVMQVPRRCSAISEVPAQFWQSGE